MQVARNCSLARNNDKDFSNSMTLPDSIPGRKGTNESERETKKAAPVMYRLAVVFLFFIFIRELMEFYQFIRGLSFCSDQTDRPPVRPSVSLALGHLAHFPSY